MIWEGFLVPGKVVSKHPKKDYAEPHKIPLSGQHRNHSSEGQINIKHIFNLSKYFEIKGYSHATPKKYSFKELKKEIFSYQQPMTDVKLWRNKSFFMKLLKK